MSGVNGMSAVASPAAEVTDLVALLAERALAIATAAAQQPSSVRISAGDVQVEICWPAAPAVTAVTTVPVAAADAAAAGAAGSGPAAETPAGHDAHGAFALCAETVGTFYSAPEPGAAPFVAEGDQVSPGQQVGIIEAMKLMIPVEAKRAGEVVELLVADRAPVEYGQPLMLLREAGQ